MTRKVYLMAALMMALSVPAMAEIELDANGDGKLDDVYIPSTITRDSELSSGLATKQNALGYTPEDAANKGTSGGYAGLGVDGKVPSAQLPDISGGASAIADLTDVDTTGKATGKILVFNESGDLVVGDDQIGASGTGDITDVLAGTGLSGGATSGAATIGLSNTAVTPGSYTYAGITIDAQGRIIAASNGPVPITAELDPAFMSWDKDYADLINSPALGTAAGLNVGTSPGNVVQLGGACTAGDGAYTTEATCTANGGQWVGALPVICDPATEGCDTKIDIISAHEINQRIAAGGGDGTTYELPSLGDAQAGTSTTPYVWSPQRVAQAIVALAPTGGAAEGYYEIDGGSSVSLTFSGDIDGGASI